MNKNKCGCDKNPCVSTLEECVCPVLISSDCMNNVKAEFPCLGIETGLTATETFEAIDQAVCDKIAEVTNYISLVNVGGGAEVYKGVNGIGQKQIRSLVGSTYITVTQTTDNIETAIDEAELTTFIENLIPESSGLESVVAGAGIEVDDTDPLNPIISADLTEHIVIPISDVVSNLTTGVSKAYFRMPFNMMITQVRASLLVSQATLGVITFDINKNGTSILSTKLTIDNTEKTSLTATTPVVISTPSVSNDDEITFDIDQVGEAGAKGAVITLIGTRIP